MPISQPIEKTRKQLEDQVVEDVAVALKTLKETLLPDSETHTIIISLMARFNGANKARLRGDVSNEDLQLEYNAIRAAVLEIIKNLREEDFGAPAASSGAATGEPAPRQGNILYRIPGTMPKDQKTKCVVRIAISEDAIVENISLDEHVQLKQLYKVSDTMQAEIIDPSGGKVFEINTISEEVQLVDEQGFTEWWFYVTPLTEGKHPLVLKISIIETVEGQPRHKEIVMEETVEVVADGPVSDDDGSPLKPAAVALNLKTASFAGLGLITGLKQTPGGQATAQTAATSSKAVATQLGLLPKIAIAVLVAGAGAAAVWFLTPEPTRDWWTTRYVVDSVEGYTSYMNEHPGGKYYEPAACRKTQLLNTPKAYRDYLYEFPDGDCRQSSEQALEQLEQESLEALEKSPSKAGLDAFLINYPECTSLERLYGIVEKDSQLSKDYLPMLLQRWEECRRQDPNFAPLPAFEGFPTPGDTIAPTPPREPAPVQHTPAQPPPGTNRPPAPAQPPGTNQPAAPEPPKPPAVIVSKPEMVPVKGGTFQMGVADGESSQNLHTVSLRDFQIGKFEVTFEEYDLFCTATGRDSAEDMGFGRGKHPVIQITWYDAVAYCNWLSEALGLQPAYKVSGNYVTLNANAKGYRLPTEAEWEYAAKGGANGEAFGYSGSDEPNEVGWYRSNSGNQTHPVGHLKPNGLGVYDMSGNAREWCFDIYEPYSNQAVANPLGPANGSRRIFRGGFWGRNNEQMRVYYRNYSAPNIKDYGTGFRLAKW